MSIALLQWIDVDDVCGCGYCFVIGKDTVPTMASLDTQNESSGQENHTENAPNGPEDEGFEGYQGEIVQVTTRQCT